MKIKTFAASILALTLVLSTLLFSTPEIKAGTKAPRLFSAECYGEGLAWNGSGCGFNYQGTAFTSVSQNRSVTQTDQTGFGPVVTYLYMTAWASCPYNWTEVYTNAAEGLPYNPQGYIDIWTYNYYWPYEGYKIVAVDQNGASYPDQVEWCSNVFGYGDYS